MTEIQRLLFALQDDRYRQFHSKLMPDVPPENVIGVRMPALRQLAKRIAQTPDKITQTPGKTAQPIDKEAFINAVPHTYYEEKTLCGLLICEETDLGKTIALLDRWLPEVDNWATCDVVKPRAFRKAMKSEPQNLLSHCLRWTKSTELFLRRPVLPYPIRASGKDSKRPLLCANGRSVVFCHRPCQAIRSHRSLSQATPAARLDTPQNHPKSRREFPH